jgi:hypothetical protein
LVWAGVRARERQRPLTLTEPGGQSRTGSPTEVGEVDTEDAIVVHSLGRVSLAVVTPEGLACMVTK